MIQCDTQFINCLINNEFRFYRFIILMESEQVKWLLGELLNRIERFYAKDSKDMIYIRNLEHQTNLTYLEILLNKYNVIVKYNELIEIKLPLDFYRRRELELHKLTVVKLKEI